MSMSLRKSLAVTILALALLAASIFPSWNVVVAQEGSYVREALQGAIFIYDATSKPCDPPPPDTTLLPLGSGFIVGLAIKGAKPPVPGRTQMYKFLITAQHVLILDEELMKDQEVREGTDVFTVGYLFGYSGNRQNYPVAKFGKVAMLTNEVWYRSQPPRNMDEEAYLVELQNVPGLSGAPMMLQSPQFRIDKEGKFQFRRVTPLIVGVIKGLLRSPIGGTQGVAAIEPAYRLRELLKKIADELKANGIEVELQSPSMKKQ